MVDPVIIASVSSALLGAFFTYLLRVWKDKQDREKRAQHLRKGILADLESMGFFDNWHDYYSEWAVPVHDIASRSYFEAVAGELPQLSESETEAIVDFYSGLDNVNKMVRLNHDLNMDASRDLGNTTGTERVARNKKLIVAIESLDSARDEAIEAIKDNLQ